MDKFKCTYRKAFGKKVHYIKVSAKTEEKAARIAYNAYPNAEHLSVKKMS